MHKVMWVLVVLGLLTLPLVAEDTPKAEVFGGYQYQHLGGDFTGLNTNGWAASITGNINKHFGVAADFGGVYKSVSGASAHLYTYEFGPVVAYDFGGKVNPFAHALFGGFTIGGSATGLGSGSTNGFAMRFGGGVDVAVNKVLAIRLAQFDWDYYRSHGITEDKNVSIATGIVLRF